MASTSAYRWDLLPRLAEEVMHGRIDQVTRLIPELLDEIAVYDDVGFLKLRCAQCLSACLRAALRGGAPGQALYAEHLAVLRRMADLHTRAAVRRCFRAAVLALADRCRPGTRSRIERAVQGMLTDMAASLARPRTLAAYAADLGLSVGHLSRSFTRIVGRSFRDEQRRLRDAAARDLLVRSRLTVAVIAGRVGLSSAAQFIADFRRAHGITPAVYRRRHGQTVTAGV